LRRDRIGILGGAFNPPHIGHLIIAEWVRNEFSLKQIIFIPTFLPPHKESPTPFEVRFQMVKIAVGNNRNYKVSDLEKKIAGPSYTIKTIRYFKKRFKKTDLFLIIGSDQFLEIGTWLKPEAIVQECRLVVVRRPGYDLSPKMNFFKNILISSAPQMDVSSSEIRKRIRQGLTIRHLVPKPLYTFIKSRNLYC